MPHQRTLRISGRRLRRCAKSVPSPARHPRRWAEERRCADLQRCRAGHAGGGAEVARPQHPAAAGPRPVPPRPRSLHVPQPRKPRLHLQAVPHADAKPARPLDGAAGAAGGGVGRQPAEADAPTRARRRRAAPLPRGREGCCQTLGRAASARAGAAPAGSHASQARVTPAPPDGRARPDATVLLRRADQSPGPRWEGAAARREPCRRVACRRALRGCKDVRQSGRLLRRACSSTPCRTRRRSHHVPPVEVRIPGTIGYSARVWSAALARLCAPSRTMPTCKRRRAR